MDGWTEKEMEKWKKYDKSVHKMERERLYGKPNDCRIAERRTFFDYFRICKDSIII